MITVETATTLLSAAHEAASKLNIKISVVVVNNNANPIAMMVHPAANWTTAGIATAKAGTALAFGRPTSEVAEIEATQAARFALVSGQVNFPITTLEGGFPIIVNNEQIGAIAVSGGTGEQDAVCAMAALKQAGLV